MLSLFGFRRRPRRFTFKCSSCGEVHSGSPSLSYERPPYCAFVPAAEQETRIQHDEDLCRILPGEADDSEPSYWIRSTLDIPIHDAEEPFCWGVWVTQSRESFERYVRTFAADQSGDGSFGWLPVSMAYYCRTPPGEPFEHLKCNVAWGSEGQRPKVLLQESGHPLYLDQRDGITWETAIEIAELALHGAD